MFYNWFISQENKKIINTDHTETRQYVNRYITSTSDISKAGGGHHIVCVFNYALQTDRKQKMVFTE